MLRALTTQGNKITGPAGVGMLRPDLMDKINTPLGGDMSHWLAQYNRDDEGESLLRFSSGDSETECKHTKMKSGMLDKSTMNIRQKQVWPQKNLGEDWAEEDLHFKQIRFEHLVAGETRTIEMAMEPAQILGRLRLLRRMAYLRLRGYEWTMLRKIYAAILTSIETGENTWESNFDRYETILHRKVAMDPKIPQQQERPHEKKIWYCRDYNKEGCNKSSPHPAWFGSGPSAVKRQVIHACASCLLRGKQVAEHPENHPQCPNKD